MRRRSRMKALKILRLFAQGRIVVFLMIMLCTIVILGEPGYLDFDNLPETNFTCAGKVIGGYYADLETSCQMFHVCTIGQLDEPMDIKFLCLNGTVFDQETRVCERVDEVDCTKSERFYYLNLELYGNTMVPIPGEDSSMSSISSTLTSSSPLSITPSISLAAISSSDNHNHNDDNNNNNDGDGDDDDDGDGDADDGVNHNHASTSPTMYSSTVSTIKPIITTLSSTTIKATLPPKLNNNYSNKTTQKLMTTSTTITSKAPTNTDSSAAHNGEDDEYDYDDEFLTTDGKELQNYQDTNQQSDLNEQVFSPEQFIFHQNINKNQNKGNLNRNNNENTSSNGKPAISFQQQQFQNGDSLTVTNSHVTITTHTAKTSGGGSGGGGVNGSNGKPTKQFSSKPKEVEVKKDQQNQNKSSYGNGVPPSSSPINNNQRQPLNPPDLDIHGPPLSHPGLPSRLAAHGFRLPSSSSSSSSATSITQQLPQKDDQKQLSDKQQSQHKYEPSFEEQHQRYLEQHQRHLEQLQQQEHDQQQKQQEDIRKQQEQQRQEQERLNQQREKDNLKLELEQQSQVSTAFEGYRRFTPQIPLRLPFEESTGIDDTVGNDSGGDGGEGNSNIGSEIAPLGSVTASGSQNQPEFLVFDQTDLDFPLQEHKDLKRSDPPRDRLSGPLPLTSELNIDKLHNHHPYNQFHRETILNNSSQINDQQQRIAQPSAAQSIYHKKSSSSPLRTSSTTKTTSSSSRRSSSSTSSSSSNSNINNNNNQPAIDTVAGNGEISSERDEQHQQHQQNHQHQRINQNNNKYDKVLLTLQDQYIPSLPKVIITASASVSDGSGKILNYSVGNIVGSKIKIPPSTYDEYKEDDVVLDPFFLDVPKIKQRRTISSTTTTTTTATQRQSG